MHAFIHSVPLQKQALTKEDVLKARLNIKQRMDSLTTNVQMLEDQMFDVYHRDTNEEQSQTQSQGAEGQDQSTSEQPKPTSIPVQETKIERIPSQLIAAIVAIVFDECSREELWAVCQNANVVPTSDVLFADVTKGEMMGWLERKVFRSLMWWRS